MIVHGSIEKEELIKKNNIKCLNFIGLLAHMVKVSDHTKCIFQHNEWCIARPTLIDLNPRQIHYYPLIFSLDRCNGFCNTLNNLLSRIRVLNKTKDVNLNVFNMIARLNESKTLAKHTKYFIKCKFAGRKCKSNQKWNIELCRRGCKNPIKYYVRKEDYIWNPSACSCEVDEYLKIIIGDSVVTCDEIIETVATSYNKSTNVNKKGNL